MASQVSGRRPPGRHRHCGNFPFARRAAGRYDLRLELSAVFVPASTATSLFVGCSVHVSIKSFVDPSILKSIRGNQGAAARAHVCPPPHSLFPLDVHADVLRARFSRASPADHRDHQHSRRATRRSRKSGSASQQELRKLAQVLADSVGQPPTPLRRSASRSSLSCATASATDRFSRHLCAYAPSRPGRGSSDVGVGKRAQHGIVVGRNLQIGVELATSANRLRRT